MDTSTPPYAFMEQYLISETQGQLLVVVNQNCHFTEI
jgi:hypothetical protein